MNWVIMSSWWCPNSVQWQKGSNFSPLLAILISFTEWLLLGCFPFHLLLSISSLFCLPLNLPKSLSYHYVNMPPLNHRITMIIIFLTLFSRISLNLELWALPVQFDLNRDNFNATNRRRDLFDVASSLFCDHVLYNVVQSINNIDRLTYVW